MRFFILLLTILVASPVLAQFENSNWLISASFREPIDLSELRIIPEAAYAVNSNTIVGVSLNAELSSNKVLDSQLSSESKGYGLSFEPYIEKFYGIGGNWFFTLRGFGVLDWNKNKTTRYFEEDVFSKAVARSKAFGLGLRPGISYKPNEWLIVKGGLGEINYSYSRSKNGADSVNFKRSALNINQGFYELSVIFILPNKG